MRGIGEYEGSDPPPGRTCIGEISIPATKRGAWSGETTIPYGGPEIGRRAAALMPNAHLEVIPARHAAFLDDPQRCSALINQLLGP